MKKWIKGLGMVTLILGIGAVSLVVWQRENIVAVAGGIKYSEEEIAQQIAQSKQNVEEVFSRYDMPSIRDFTLEEEEAIRRGELTAEEAVAKLFDQSTATDEHQDKQEEVALGTQETAEVIAEVIATYTAQMYALKAKYLGVLGGIEQSAISAYKGLAKEDRTMGQIQKIISSHISQGLSMEAQCNSEVEGVLTALEEELVARGADTTIVQTMREAYNSEKSLKKSYYLSLVKQ